MATSSVNGGSRNNMNSIDLDELERLANEAPDGPWQVVEEKDFGSSDSNSCAIVLGYTSEKLRAWGYGPFLDDEDDEGEHIYNKRFICSLDDGELERYVDKDEMKKTALYIAAIHPGTTKALIARIRELEDENKKLR